MNFFAKLTFLFFISSIFFPSTKTGFLINTFGLIVFASHFQEGAMTVLKSYRFIEDKCIDYIINKRDMKKQKKEIVIDSVVDEHKDIVGHPKEIVKDLFFDWMKESIKSKKNALMSKVQDTLFFYFNDVNNDVQSEEESYINFAFQMSLS